MIYIAFTCMVNVHTVHAIYVLGDGKTHYIEKNQLVGNHMIIAVNEAFSVLNTISKLRMLPTDQNCTIHFNFTFIPPSKVHVSLIV